jgi:hypothetical protein
MADETVIRGTGSPLVRALGGGNVGISFDQPAKTSTLGQIGKVIDLISNKLGDNEKKKQQKFKDATDMYKTLRQAGYDPKSAFEAVQSGKFPDQPGDLSLDEKKDQASLEKTKADTELAKAKTEKTRKESQGVIGKSVFIVDQTGSLKKIGQVGKNDKVFKQSRSSQDFTATELQEIMASSRYSPDQKAAAQKMLNDRLGVSANETGEVKGVPMIKDGTTRLIHPEDVTKAQKAGWKRA